MKPHLLERGSSIFVRYRRGGGVVLDLTAIQEPQQVAYFENDPWFVNAGLIGKTLLVRLNRNLGALNVYRLAKPVSLNKLQIESEQA